MADTTATSMNLTKLVLLLDDEEKSILAGWMQNPIHNQETVKESKLRESIFKAIKPPTSNTR